jgi:hypothetical protein
MASLVIARSPQGDEAIQDRGPGACYPVLLRCARNDKRKKAAAEAIRGGY